MHNPHVYATFFIPDRIILSGFPRKPVFKYDDDQARWPAGTPGGLGGQWRGDGKPDGETPTGNSVAEMISRLEGAMGATTTDSPRSARPRQTDEPAQKTEPRPPSLVWVSDTEAVVLPPDPRDGYNPRTGSLEAALNDKYGDKPSKKQQRELDAARTADEGLQDMADLGYEIPEDVIMGPPIYREMFPPGPIGWTMWAIFGPMFNNGTVAAYNSGSDTMSFNVGDEAWSNLPEKQQQMYDIGWWSSPDPKHVVYHETAHYLHNKKDPELFQNLPDHFEDVNEEFLVMDQVSQYGATEPVEMVAEVFAATIAGKQFSPEVLALYEKYGGPELP